MINRISLSRIIMMTTAVILVGILIIVFLQIEDGSAKPLSYEVIERQQEKMQEKIQQIQQRNRLDTAPAPHAIQPPPALPHAPPPPPRKPPVPVAPVLPHAYPAPAWPAQAPGYAPGQVPAWGYYTPPAPGWGYPQPAPAPWPAPWPPPR